MSKLTSMVNMMKKTMEPTKKRTRKGTKQKPKADVEAAKILRTVGDREAFYFYEAIGKPTGERARSLPDFVGRIKSVKTESLLFHIQRRDFGNWIGKTLGDCKLARELEEISSSNNDDVRMDICKTVENRIKELSETSPTILADQNSAVLMLPATSTV